MNVADIIQLFGLFHNEIDKFYVHVFALLLSYNLWCMA